MISLEQLDDMAREAFTEYYGNEARGLIGSWDIVTPETRGRWRRIVVRIVERTQAGEKQVYGKQ